jgi:uncharacterized short protein YbdD (DUF466 family)
MTTEMKRRWAMSAKAGTGKTAGIAGIAGIARIAGMASIAGGARALRQSLRLMVGVPEYDTYVAHMRNKHPDQPVMPYQEFFRERQEARYGSKVSRCC